MSAASAVVAATFGVPGAVPGPPPSSPASVGGSSPTAPANASTQQSSTIPVVLARDGQSLSTQAKDVIDNYVRAYGTNAASRWASEHNAAATSATAAGPPPVAQVAQPQPQQPTCPAGYYLSGNLCYQPPQQTTPPVPTLVTDGSSFQGCLTAASLGCFVRYFERHPKTAKAVGCSALYLIGAESSALKCFMGLAAEAIL